MSNPIVTFLEEHKVFRLIKTGKPGSFGPDSSLDDEALDHCFHEMAMTFSIDQLTTAAKYLISQGFDNGSRRLAHVLENAIGYKQSDIRAFVPGLKLLTRRGSYTTNCSLKRVLVAIQEYIRDEGLEIDPEFQRVHVWNEERQVRWIEYILRGGRDTRAVTIMFNNPKYNNARPLVDYYNKALYNDFVLVDGKQRLEALRRFMADELVVFGKYRASDLAPCLAGMSYTLTFEINDLLTEQEVLQWYVDLNDGGVAHTQEEIDKVRSMISAL